MNRTTGGDNSNNIAGYAGALRRRWGIIAFVVVVAVAASLAVIALRTAVYQATAELLIQPTDDLSDSAPAAIDPEEVATQARVVTSLPVAERVVRDLDLSESPTDLLDDLSVTVNGTRVLDVEAERESADEAATIANAFAANYLAYRDDSVTKASDAAIRQIEAQRRALERELSRLQADIAGATGAQVEALKAERSSLLIQLGQTRASLIGITQQSSTLSGGEVLLPATAPDSAAGQSPWRIAVLVAVLALIVGAGLALLRDALDPTT